MLFLMGIGAVCVVFGLVEIIRKTVFFFSDAKNCADRYILLVLPQTAGECEYLVRSAAERIRWQEWGEAMRLLCVIRDEDEETEKICEKLKEEYPYLHISKSTDLGYNMIDSLE